MNLPHVLEWDLSYKSWSILLQNLVTISAFSTRPPQIHEGTTFFDWEVTRNRVTPWLWWVVLSGWQAGGGGEDEDWLSVAAVCGIVVVVLAEVRASFLCKRAWGGQKGAHGHCARAPPGNVKVKPSASLVFLHHCQNYTEGVKLWMPS